MRKSQGTLVLALLAGSALVSCQANTARIAELERELGAVQQRVDELAARVPANTKPAAEAAKRHALREPLQRARNLSKEWTEAAMQTRDQERRAAALDEIRAAIGSADGVLVKAGLTAVVQLHELKFDRVGLRPGILRALDSEDGQTRRAAMYALRVDPRPEVDVPRLQAMVDDDDPLVRAALTNLLRLYGKGKLHGASADAVVRVLERADGASRRTALSGLWGADVDKRIADHCLQLAKDPARRHDAIYFGLSTFNPKSSAVVTELLTALEGPLGEDSSRASWGLQIGVQQADQMQVADAYLRLLEQRSGARWRVDALRQLERYGSRKHVDGLRDYAAGEGVTPQVKAEVERIIGRIRDR